MGVSTEIAQHVFWPTEGPLGVDDPVVAKQRPEPGGEGVRLGKRSTEAVLSLRFDCPLLLCSRRVEYSSRARSLKNAMFFKSSG